MRRRETRASVIVAHCASGALGCLVLGFLSSCGSTREITPPAASVPAVYSVIFVIHGDGDYLYHDRDGNAFQADEQTLAAATVIARKNLHAEVFVFHERPARSFLLLFHLPDGDFYYFRNGSLIARESYWRERTDFSTESELYDRFRQKAGPGTTRMFLYFGHEIPEFRGEGYDASYPDREYSIRDLAGALKSVRGDSSKFDVLVLSTCFNGTPYSVAAVSPFARYIIASPDNLHLSYFDITSLAMPDSGLKREELPAFTARFAQKAFDRLTRDVETAVTVAVYDVNRVQGFLGAVSGTYSETLRSLRKAGSTVLADHCDCADDSSYVRPGMGEGVQMLYRPPQFGRMKNKQTHSGWECWKMAEIEY